MKIRLAEEVCRVNVDIPTRAELSASNASVIGRVRHERPVVIAAAVANGSGKVPEIPDARPGSLRWAHRKPAFKSQGIVGNVRTGNDIASQIDIVTLIDACEVELPVGDARLAAVVKECTVSVS